MNILPNIIRKLKERELDKMAEETLVLRLAKDGDLSSLAEKQIRKKLGAEDAPLKAKEDNRVVAGFMAEYKGLLFDGSAKGQLGKIREVFRKN